MDKLNKIFKNQEEKNSLLKEAGFQNKIFKAWELTVDQAISNNANPGKFRNGVLNVYVSSSVWANQLSLLKDKLSKKINKVLGLKLVKDIRFKVGIIITEKKEEAEQEKNFIDEPGERKIEEIISSLTEKIKKSNQEKRKHGQTDCLACGELHPAGEGLICKNCRLNHKKSLTKSIKQYLRKTPWASFSEIKGELPETKYEEFSKAKREELSYLKDETEKVYREIKKEKGNRLKAKLTLKLKALVYGTAMLRLNKKPEELDDQRLKKAMSSKIKKIIFR